MSHWGCSRRWPRPQPMRRGHTVGHSLRQLQSRWPTKTIGSAICVPTPCGPLSSCGLGSLPNPYLGHNIDAIVICTYTFNIFTYINFFLGFRNHCDCNLWWPPPALCGKPTVGGPLPTRCQPRLATTYLYIYIFRYMYMNMNVYI